MADKQMTLVEHLDELRRRILVSVAAIIICACAAFWKIQVILKLLMFPPVDHLNFFSPTEAFMEYCKLSFFVGLFLASPVVLYQLWAFVSAGLSEKEKKEVVFALPFSATLFLGGAVFAYYFVIPWALNFLINFFHLLRIVSPGGRNITYTRNYCPAPVKSRSRSSTSRDVYK